jgi:amino acid permease
MSHPQFGLVYPLMCLESLSSLQIIGKLGMGCAIFLGVAISFRAIQSLTDPEHPPCHADIWYASDVIGMFRALPLFAFSFVCHLNVLPVYDELRSRTPTRMKRVISQALSFVSVYYGMVSE